MQLTDEFADFFIGKIEKIRDSLDQHPLYDPPKRDVAQRLSSFRELNQEEVWKVMGRLQTKSCEFEIILTYILKDNIDKFIPVLTKLVNLSLTTGVFADDWKVAVLRPLLKRCG